MLNQPTGPGTRYPIQDGPSVPWEVLAPHEAQAQRNHGQTLEQLAARGGLGCVEAYAIVHGLKIREVEAIGFPEAKARWLAFAERENSAVAAAVAREKEGIARMVELWGGPFNSDSKLLATSIRERGSAAAIARCSHPIGAGESDGPVERCLICGGERRAGGAWAPPPVGDRR